MRSLIASIFDSSSWRRASKIFCWPAIACAAGRLAAVRHEVGGEGDPVGAVALGDEAALGGPRVEQLTLIRGEGAGWPCVVEADQVWPAFTGIAVLHQDGGNDAALEMLHGLALSDVTVLEATTALSSGA